MRVTPPAAPDPNLFLEARPRDLHAPPSPWHRLAFIVRELPRGLERMSRMLEVPAGGRVLDFGCGDMPYRHLFGADVEVVGADLPGNRMASLTIADDGTVDVADASFDAVLSTQVLEHVADPVVYLRECHRVLRPGGRLLLSTHGIMIYHPDPVDYWRWTCAGLERAVADAGLEVRHAEGIMGLAATGLQLVQEAFYYRIPLRLRPLLALVFQSLARIADRVDTPEGRNMNAMVLAVVAEKP